MYFKNETRLQCYHRKATPVGDSEGFYVASVPALPGCHTQARSLDDLRQRLREVIELCLEVHQDHLL
ncbi:MAG: type II toxin-antitoxin system HicB family antitoxin [Nitrososphaera sp.]